MGVYLGLGIYSKESSQKIKLMGDTFKINDTLDINRENMLFLSFNESIFSNFEVFYGKFFLFPEQLNKSKLITLLFEPTSISFTLYYPESRSGDLYQEREYELQIYKLNKTPNYILCSYPEYGVEENIQSHILYEFWLVPTYAYKLLSKTMKLYSYTDQLYDSLIKKILNEILDVELPSDNISETKNQLPEDTNFIIPSGIPVTQLLEWIRKRLFPNKDKYNLPLYFINNKKLYFKFINDYTIKRDIYLGSKKSNMYNYKNLEDYISKTSEIIEYQSFVYVNKNRSTVNNLLITRNIKSIIEGKGDIPIKRILIEFMNSFLPEPLYQDEWKDLYKDWYQYDQQFLDDPLLLEDRAGFLYSTLMLGFIQNSDQIIFETNNMVDIKTLEDLNILTVLTLHISDLQFTGSDEKQDNEIKVLLVVEGRTHILFPLQLFWHVIISTIIDSKFINLNNTLYKLDSPIEDQNKLESANQSDNFGETSDGI